MSIEEWGERARCKGADTNQFMSFLVAEQRMVKQEYCERCPVREECLEYAMDASWSSNIPGIWGGMTEDERKGLKSMRETA